MDLKTFDDIEPFLKRPFFALIYVDGPLRLRFERERAKGKQREPSANAMTLEEFVDQHDLLLSGPSLSSALPKSVFAKHPQTDFKRASSLATLSICNNLPSLPALHAYLDELDLTNEERLRPGWDMYFMVSLIRQ